MTLTKRIICVGNRFRAEDSAGPMVYDYLKDKKLPSDVELIDGGLAGLGLLNFVKGTDRVVFVDAVNGFESSDNVLIISMDEAAKHADTAYGHSSGLAYLFRVLPHVQAGNLPEIYIVGVNGFTDQYKVSEAAEMSLNIAIRGENPRIDK